MAKEQTNPEAVRDQAYSLAELRENARILFGVAPEVIDGALYKNSQHEFAVAELQALIKAFLKRKVQ